MTYWSGVGLLEDRLVLATAGCKAAMVPELVLTHKQLKLGPGCQLTCRARSWGHLLWGRGSQSWCWPTGVQLQVPG